MKELANYLNRAGETHLRLAREQAKLRKNRKQQIRGVGGETYNRKWAKVYEGMAAAINGETEV